MTALALSACGGGEASRPTPQEPSARLEVHRTLEAVVLIDDRQRKVPDHEVRNRARLRALSQGLTEAMGVAVQMKALVDLPEVPRDALDDVLGALEQHEGLPKADLYIALIGDPPPTRPTIGDLVVSRYGGRIIVSRTLSARFPAHAQSSRLAAERALLMQGAGRIFGALPACGQYYMGRQPPLAWASPDRRPLSWHPLNLTLMRRHRDIDLRPESTRQIITAEVAKDAAALIETDLPSAVARCRPAELDAHRRLLRSLAEPSAKPPPPPAPVPSPSNPDVVDGLAALEAEQWGKAYALCAPAAEADPTGDAPRCAGLAAEKLDRPSEAISFLRAHLAHHPADDVVMLRLARLLGRSGDDGAARALLEGFVGRNPSSVKARLNLGVAYARLGDYKRARVQWQAVLDLSPDHPTAKKLLAQLPTP